jgi:hypothetical protein
MVSLRFCICAYCWGLTRTVLCCACQCVTRLLYAAAAYTYHAIAEQLLESVPGSSAVRTVGAAALVSAPISAALYRNAFGAVIRTCVTCSYSFWNDG